jgi:GT2 family glycosyltransferase
MATTSSTIGPGIRPTARTDGLVTILVSCCGQLEYTRFCAPSVLRHSRLPFEIVFLDCDSLDGTAEYLEGFAAAAPVRVEVTRVAAEPPTGAGRKEDVIPLRGEFVALLNNDVIVTPGWLERLVSLASSAADIGMVAPMSNHAPAALLVDPIPYGIELIGDELPAGQRPNPWHQIDKVSAFSRQWQEQNQGQGFEAEALSGGCVLLKREVLQKLGLFPTRTPLGTFDTQALSARVRQAGYRLLGCRAVFVHDFGSRSPVRR